MRVLDIGSRGVLIEAPTRLHIGMRVELTLFATEANTRLDLMGVVRRCHVASLSPIAYRGALEFNQAIEVQALQPFLSTAPSAPDLARRQTAWPPRRATPVAARERRLRPPFLLIPS